MRIIPLPDRVSAPFWAACARHELTLARCRNCREFSHPPELICPHCQCLTPDWQFEPVCGRGRLRSWTVIRQSFLTGFDVPFLLADVALDAHPEIRLIGRLLDGPDTDLSVGDAMALAFEDITAGIAVPAFRRAMS